DIRSLLLAAVKDSEEQPEDLPAPADKDVEAWDWALDAIEERIFWDRDFTLGDEFLDQPPDASQALHALAGIDPEYFTTIPREPNKAGLIAVRLTLARLVERPLSAVAGLYPAISDLYHDLIIGPCTQEEIDAWEHHPWLEVI